MSTKAAYSHTDKTVKQGVSIPQSVLDGAKERAKIAHGGNLSRYLASLIESDMKGGSASASGDGSRIIEELAARFCGARAPAIAASLHGIQQGELLDDILRQLPDYFEAVNREAAETEAARIKAQESAGFDEDEWHAEHGGASSPQILSRSAVGVLNAEVDNLHALLVVLKNASRLDGFATVETKTHGRREVLSEWSANLPTSSAAFYFREGLADPKQAPAKKSGRSAK